MKTLSKIKDQPGLWMVDAPMPKPGHNDLLIKITKSAICGTDLHIYNWDEWSQNTIKIPTIIGHEYVGIVADMGPEVRGFSVGDRVTGEGHIICGYCRNCRGGRTHLCRNTIGVGVNRNGAFAEYLVIPAFNAFKLDDCISDELAAIFDPLGNAVHAALSFDLVGEDVLITGAGPIGMMAVAICRWAGARHIVITDPNLYRLSLAKKLGATRCLRVGIDDPQKAMRELDIREGFDIGLEMSGVENALAEMLELMNHGGKIALLGLYPGKITIDWKVLILKGLLVKGIYGREMFETWYKMASIIRSGMDLKSIITHRFPIDQFEQGFAVMNSGQSGKVILNWDEAKV